MVDGLFEALGVFFVLTLLLEGIRRVFQSREKFRAEERERRRRQAWNDSRRMI